MWKEGRMMEDGRMIAKKSISCMRVLCVYRTLLAAQKRIRTAILSTDHSLFTLKPSTHVRIEVPPTEFPACNGWPVGW